MTSRLGPVTSVMKTVREQEGKGPEGGRGSREAGGAQDRRQHSARVCAIAGNPGDRSCLASRRETVLGSLTPSQYTSDLQAAAVIDKHF